MMAKSEKSKKQSTASEGSEGLWRKPITLDSFEDEDPLAALYQGREVGDKITQAEVLPKKTNDNAGKPSAKETKTTKKDVTSKKPKKSPVRKTTKPVNESKTITSKSKAASTRLTEEELKDLLKIKSDAFQFTDIREILRGKSLDIYAYLRHFAGDAGVCKITHNNLMDILHISRPTLFKQSDWLEKLSLIEKQSVPGDHTGTSYIVYRLEDALPVSETLVEQFESHIETIGTRN
jgi:hypothetical protein